LSKLKDYTLQAKEIEATVTALSLVKTTDTKYGKRAYTEATVTVNSATFQIRLWLGPEGSTDINLRSTTAKVLMKYKCKKLADLIGKKVKLVLDNRGFYRWAT